MNRKTILIPNLLVLFYTVTVYHAGFLSGHISRTVLLLLCASALALFYGLYGKMWNPLKIFTALINIILFSMFAYIFSGISYMLIKHGTANPVIYAAICLILIFVALVIITKKKTVAIAFNILLLLFAIAGYLLWNTMPLKASLNAAVFGVIAAIGFLNVYFIIYSLIKRDSLKRF